MLQLTFTYRFGPGFSEERFQITTSQKLQNDKPRVFFKAHSNEMNYVGMIEFGHDQSLHQEIHLSLVCAQFWQCFDCHCHLK